MKLNVLSLAVYLGVLLSPSQCVTAQDCFPDINLAGQRLGQSVAVTWQGAPGADYVLCYRWTLVQHGWRADWQRVLPGDASSLLDDTVGPAKTYEYGIAVHYPDCGWAPWQYVVVGPYTAGSTQGTTSNGKQTP